METFFGVPAHPLLVHLPVVLLPLSAVGAVLVTIRRSWFDRYKWIVLSLAGLGALGGILAAGSGESLEEAISAEDRRLIESHAEMGETARLLGIIFFLLVLAWILVPMILERRRAAAGTTSGAARSGAPTWLHPVLAALVLAGAVGSVWAVASAGHSGAERVWNEKSEAGERDGDGD